MARSAPCADKIAVLAEDHRVGKDDVTPVLVLFESRFSEL